MDFWAGEVKQNPKIEKITEKEILILPVSVEALD